MRRKIESIIRREIKSGGAFKIIGKPVIDVDRCIMRVVVSYRPCYIDRHEYEDIAYLDSCIHTAIGNDFDFTYAEWWDREIEVKA